jgi:hypothetical protein
MCAERTRVAGKELVSGGIMQRRIRRAVFLISLLSGAHALAQEGVRQANITINPDGSVQVPAHTVPLSAFLTPEGTAYLEEHLRNMRRPELLVQDNGVPPLLEGYLERQRELFAVERRDGTMVPMAWPAIFDYFDRVSARDRGRAP